jgi:uncharacterized membrane protein YgcG
LLSLQVAVLGTEAETETAQPGREQAPIFEVLYDELSRVKVVLEERAKVESLVTTVSKQSLMHVLLSQPCTLTASSGGVTIPDVPMRKPANTFAISLWLKLKERTGNGTGHSGTGHSGTGHSGTGHGGRGHGGRRVLCMSARPLPSSEGDVDVCPAMFVTYQEDGAPYLEVVISTRDEETESVVYNLVKSKHALPSNQWTHVVVDYDGACLCVYVNGNKDGQEQMQDTPLGHRQRSRPFHVGGSGGGGNSGGGNSGGGGGKDKAVLDKFQVMGSVEGDVASVSWHEKSLSAVDVLTLSSGPNPR